MSLIVPFCERHGLRFKNINETVISVKHEHFVMHCLDIVGNWILFDNHCICHVLVYEIYILVRIINDPWLCIKLWCCIHGVLMHQVFYWIRILYIYMGSYAKRLYRMKWPKVYHFMKVSSFFVYKEFIILLLALHYIYFLWMILILSC